MSVSICIHLHIFAMDFEFLVSQKAGEHLDFLEDCWIQASWEVNSVEVARLNAIWLLQWSYHSACFPWAFRFSSPSLHFDWLVQSLSRAKMTLKLLKCVFFRHPVRSNGFCYISTSPLRDPHFHDPSHKWLLSVKDKVTSLQRGGIYGCQRWEFLGKCEGCSILDGSSFKNTCT